MADKKNSESAEATYVKVAYKVFLDSWELRHVRSVRVPVKQVAALRRVLYADFEDSSCDQDITDRDGKLREILAGELQNCLGFERADASPEVRHRDPRLRHVPWDLVEWVRDLLQRRGKTGASKVLGISTLAVLSVAAGIQVSKLTLERVKLAAKHRSPIQELTDDEDGGG